jgi:hypothetical protein
MHPPVMTGAFALAKLQLRNFSNDPEGTLNDDHKRNTGPMLSSR